MIYDILTSDANANAKNDQSKDEEDDRPVFENVQYVWLTRKEVDLVLANSGPTLDTFLQWGHLKQKSECKVKLGKK